MLSLSIVTSMLWSVASFNYDYVKNKKKNAEKSFCMMIGTFSLLRKNCLIFALCYW